MPVDHYYLALLGDDELEAILRTATDVDVWEAAHAVWKSRHGANWRGEATA